MTGEQGVIMPVSNVQQPDAAPGGGRRREKAAVSRLPGVDGRGGHRDPHRRAGRTAGPRRPVPPRNRVRRGPGDAQNLRRPLPPGEAARRRVRRLTPETIR
ncbi:MAG: hypothetical protein MZV70_55630 [Desulfobacterales bacterium]|nr:hypothetical protein [Desulfobacterales bacterium]